MRIGLVLHDIYLVHATISISHVMGQMFPIIQDADKMIHVCCYPQSLSSISETGINLGTPSLKTQKLMKFRYA